MAIGLETTPNVLDSLKFDTKHVLSAYTVAKEAKNDEVENMTKCENNAPIFDVSTPSFMGKVCPV